MNTISINRRLSCLSLQPVCEEHRKRSLQREEHRSKKSANNSVAFFSQEHPDLLCVYKNKYLGQPGMNCGKWGFWWGLCDWASLSSVTLSSIGPKPLLTPPDLLIPAAASITRKANQIVPTLYTTQTRATASTLKRPRGLIGFLESHDLLPLLDHFIFISRCNICFLLF